MWARGNVFRAFQPLLQLLRIKLFDHKDLQLWRAFAIVSPGPSSESRPSRRDCRNPPSLRGPSCHHTFPWKTLLEVLLHWAWKPVQIIGLIVLENPPAVGKRVVANIGRLSSPNTSVHLQVPSLAQDQVSQVRLPSYWKWLISNYQAWGSPNIDRCLESVLRWRIWKFSRVINHELVCTARWWSLFSSTEFEWF